MIAGVTIAAAQTRPVKGDIEANIKDHEAYIALAAEHQADAIFYPELSLTGYEPELAAETALGPDDKRLEPLTILSRRHKMVVCAGAPLSHSAGKPFLGLFCLFGDRVQVYRKRHLHPGEEKYFSEGKESGVLKLTKATVGLAICADIAHPSHAADAAGLGATVYAPCVFISPKGYAPDTALLREYASRHSMAVLMANYCGMSGGMASAGKSALWDEAGRLVVAAEADKRQLIIADNKTGQWTGKVLTL